MQGMFQGCYMGAGAGVGSLVGGALLATVGMQWMWGIGSMIVVGGWTLHAAVRWVSLCT